jgi:hypothetical protein
MAMRRLLLIGAALLPVLLFAFATDVAADQGNNGGNNGGNNEQGHRTIRLETTLRGANEVPAAVGSDLTGDATVTIDLSRNRLCWKLDYDTNQTVIAAHIHKGAAGVAAPVVFGFFNPPPSATVVNRGCRTGDPALLGDIVNHPAAYYVNVHTTVFKGGAGRGQLSAESDD